MTIFLCGFMGCGKSALGKALSRLLELPLIDTDEEIVRQEQCSIPEIFAEKGEPYFRRREQEVVVSFCGRDAVISCGGGAMLNPETARAVREQGGIIVYLKQSFAVCYDRIKDDTNRPIVQKNSKEQLEALYTERETVYQRHATYTVAAGDTPEASAERVLTAIDTKTNVLA